MDKGRAHITTGEMCAIEQVLLHWASKWKGKALGMHVENRAVAHCIASETIREASRQVLRRCLLLASEDELEVGALLVPTKENALADALLL